MDKTIEHLSTALGRSYTNLELFRTGGMARLYSVRDQLLQRDLVIKVLNWPKEDPERAAERLSREAHALVALNHPNIIPISFAGEYDADGTPQLFFAMKKIAGETLDGLPERVDSRETARILWELASALDHAHSSGIYHRDIKPANICLEDRTRRAIVLDFGIAAIDGSAGLTQDGVVLGTATYMSPEQLNATHTADPRVDIYAVGEIGARLLTCRDPFPEGLMPHELLARKRTWTDAELRRLAPETPEALLSVIRRCLEWDMADRYPSAHALARDLEALLPKISLPALHHSITSKEIDTAFWQTLGVNAGLLPPLGPSLPPISVHSLHNWLAEFGYTSIAELRKSLDDLAPSSSAVLSDFVRSCSSDDPPYAVGVDVIRIVLGIKHMVTIAYPDLATHADYLTRQIDRFLKQPRTKRVDDTTPNRDPAQPAGA